LTVAFQFLEAVYTSPGMDKSRFATDQTHFYTMVTSMLFSDMLSGKPLAEIKKLQSKLVKFSKIIDGDNVPPRAISTLVSKYEEQSSQQTTHVGRRIDRQESFLKIIERLE
jgi:hypothetical protein